MSRLIDADKLMEEIESYRGDIFANEIVELIKQMQSVDDTKWIPCSERLPEDKQKCLVTARIYFTPDHVDEIDNYIGVRIDTYSKQFEWLGTETIAWMPLPEPYNQEGVEL